MHERVEQLPVSLPVQRDVKGDHFQSGCCGLVGAETHWELDAGFRAELSVQDLGFGFDSESFNSQSVCRPLTIETSD